MSDRGKSTVVSSRSGWVGHPTVVNKFHVKGDLHFHQHVDTRQSFGETVVYGTARLVAGLVEVTTGLLYFAGTAAFACMALGIWTAGRVGNLLLWVEAKSGGSPKRLCYTPSHLRLPENRQKELTSGE